MVLYMPPTTYIAQVYDCDTYGGSAYNECSGTTVPSSNPSANSSTTTNNTTANPDTATSSDTTTSTSTDTATTTDTGGYQTNPETTNSPADAVAGLSWWWIIGIAIVIAIIGAWIIMLLKRRHRGNNIPPNPPIMPGNPTSLF
jgi:hypothetical protein